MAALAAARGTRRYGQEPTPALYEHKVKAATKVWSGGIAVLDAGYLAPGRAATALICIGRFEEDVDNSGGAAGDKLAKVLGGVFKWNNSTAGDLITQADLGAICYIVDDQTVAKTDNSAARSKCGVIVGVDSDGVWVLTGFRNV
jgi:hypothetical protein